MKGESTFYNNKYIEYKSNADTRSKNLLLKEYLYKIKPYLGDVFIVPQDITKEYLYISKPYLRDIIIQESDIWKIQLTIAINFISPKDAENNHVMHSKSDNIKFTS